MTSDIELLTRCAEFTLTHTRQVEENILRKLQTSAETSLVTALRMLRLQRALLAIGMFSLFESLLQARMGWKRPFDRLKEYLGENGSRTLAERFDEYRLAINVLKHGLGKSYEQLAAKSAMLEFKVKAEDEAFFDEGDVSEIDVLVDADDRFVRRCAELIQESVGVIRTKEGSWA